MWFRRRDQEHVRGPGPDPGPKVVIAVRTPIARPLAQILAGGFLAQDAFLSLARAGGSSPGTCAAGSLTNDSLALHTVLGSVHARMAGSIPVGGGRFAFLCNHSASPLRRQWWSRHPLLTPFAIGWLWVGLVAWWRIAPALVQEERQGV